MRGLQDGRSMERVLEKERKREKQNGSRLKGGVKNEKDYISP